MDWDEGDEVERRHAHQGVDAMLESKKCRLQQDSHGPGRTRRRAKRKFVGVVGAKESPDEGAYAVAAWPSSTSAEGLQSQGEREKTIEEP